MGTVCILCGEELSLLKRKELYCCGVPQIVCKDCLERTLPLSEEEQIEHVLRCGRAKDVEIIRAARERKLAQREKKEAMEQADREKRRTDKRCSGCGGHLLRHGPVQLKLGEETFFFSDLTRLMSGAMTLDVLYCEDCGKVEFFLPEGQKKPEEE